jgi:L-lactate dehydrogenase complex protein LldE
MLREHYPALLADDRAYAERARDLAERSWELVSFLADVRGLARHGRAYRGRRRPTTIPAPACASSGSRPSPPAARRGRRAGAASSCRGAEICCGFGGTFCVKYPEISEQDGRRQDRRHRRAPAPTRCWPAISAACSTWPAS